MLPRIKPTDQGLPQHSTYLSNSIKTLEYEPILKKSVIPSRCKTRMHSYTNSLEESIVSQFQHPQLQNRNPKINHKNHMKTLEHDMQNLKDWIHTKNYNYNINTNQIEEQLMYTHKSPKPTQQIKAFSNKYLQSIDSHQQRESPPRRYYKKSMDRQRHLGKEYYSPYQPTKRKNSESEKTPLTSIRLVSQIMHQSGTNRYLNSTNRRRLKTEIDKYPQTGPHTKNHEGLSKQHQTARYIKYKTFYASKSKPQREEERTEKNLHQITFPSSREDVENFINSYHYLTQQVRIPQAMENNLTDTIQKQFESGCYLYFGYLNRNTMLREGFGVRITKKNIMQGLWENGEIVQGAQKSSKFLYQGQFLDSKRHGNGICEWINGERYIGSWAHDKRNGLGQWSSLQGEKYYGNWIDGMATGYGVLEDKDHSVYEGQFSDFSKSGEGHQKFPNGDEYEGSFLEGLPHGKGQYIWENGMKFYGDFSQGVRQGKGRLIKPSIFSLKCGFKNDLPQGSGQLCFHNSHNIESITLKEGSLLSGLETKLSIGLKDGEDRHMATEYDPQNLTDFLSMDYLIKDVEFKWVINLIRQQLMEVSYR